MQNLQNKIISIIGKKGYGKTKLTEIIALLNDRPTIILDPKGQYQQKPYRLHFPSVGSFRKWISTKKNLEDFYTYKLELVVKDFGEDFEELCEIVMKQNTITFLIDEIDLFAEARLSKKSKFYYLVHTGRHSLIDIITTSRRPANIPRDLTSQSDYMIFSRTSEPSDKDYIKRFMGAEYVEPIASLERYEFIIYDENLKGTKFSISKKEAETV